MRKSGQDAIADAVVRLIDRPSDPLTMDSESAAYYALQTDDRPDNDVANGCPPTSCPEPWRGLWP